eukprot:11326343-Alexandrium_andersonii.AAC.1
MPRHVHANKEMRKWGMGASGPRTNGASEHLSHKAVWLRSVGAPANSADRFASQPGPRWASKAVR